MGLSVFGEWLLNLLAEWRAYVVLAGLFPVIGLTTVLSTVAGCIITFETAQGRFRFLWYAIPLSVGKTVLVYAITGYTFFQGLLPESLILMIEAWEPCRLKFVAMAFLVGQALLVGGLLLDVFATSQPRNSI